MPHTFSRLSLPACAAALVLAVPPAAAHAPFQVCASNGACSLAQSVDDTGLARVAGKFTLAGEVVGMSLQMNSSWQAANGQRLEAGATVSIGLPNSGHAHARFDTHASVTEAQSGSTPYASGSSVQPGRGLQHVRGVGQAIQVAGDGNSATNAATVLLSGAPFADGAGNGQRAALQTAGNGASARVDIGDNGVSLHLALPGGGSASQHINAGGVGGIHQGIQIAAHGQQVMNHLQLQLQMQPATRAALTTHGFTGALNMLRGR